MTAKRVRLDLSEAEAPALLVYLATGRIPHPAADAALVRVWIKLATLAQKRST